jgi:hypothetical protein
MNFGYNSDNYWAYLYATPVTGSNKIKITRWIDETYMKGVKMHVLLVSTTIGASYTMIYRTVAKTGSGVSKIFSYNLGVNTSHFG